ncbi:MAG TPA: AAA family ATPase [bacterium]|nr:AAA family ATPase [bacterium]
MNFNWSIIGNQRAIEFLDKSLSNNNIANFYIFAGPKGLGKFSTAQDLVKNIFLKDRPDLKQKDNFLQINSDFFVVEKNIDKKNISIDQIRELIENFQSGTFLDSYKAAIIKEAENLNENSANALLKVLEENKGKTLIILTVNDIDNLPATIISRGQIINFFPVKTDIIYKKLVEDLGVSPSLAKDLSKISLGRPEISLNFLRDKDHYRDYQEMVSNFLEFLDSNFSDRIKMIDGLMKKNISDDNLDILEIWQSVIRDLIFINYSQYDHVQHDFVIDKLKNIDKNNLDLAKIKERYLVIKEGENLLSANIGFRSVLEYIAVNI